jgi:hypothetical protein
VSSPRSTGFTCGFWVSSIGFTCGFGLHRSGLFLGFKVIWFRGLFVCLLVCELRQLVM